VNFDEDKKAMIQRTSFLGLSTINLGCIGEIRVVECELSTTKRKHFIKIKRYLVGKQDKTCTWEDIFKMDLKQGGQKGMQWTNLTLDGARWRTPVTH